MVRRLVDAWFRACIGLMTVLSFYKCPVQGLLEIERIGGLMRAERVVKVSCSRSAGNFARAEEQWFQKLLVVRRP